MDSPLRIYLARHGQTDWNAEKRLQGWTDIPLNATGRTQARELAAALSHLRFDCIYCSALQRSRETAELLTAGVQIVCLRDLNEQSHGRFEGQVLDNGNPEVLAEFQRRRFDPRDTLDGGESQEQHRARVLTAIDTIRGNHATGGEVLVIGHGGTNSLILNTLAGTNTDLTFRIRNTDVFLIELSANDSPQWKQLTLPTP
jgi:broad specificity phosphatase PhoE